MADYAYMKVEMDGKQIEASSTDKGFEKWSVTYAYECTAFFNFDDVQGRTTSNQHCSPVVATVKLDESAPALLKAFRKSSPLKVTFTWTDRDKGGNKVPSFEVSLQNARIVRFKQFTPHTKVRDLQELDHSVEISYSFEQITLKAVKYDSTSKSHPAIEDSFKFREPTA